MLPGETELHRLSVEDVHRMVAVGVLQEEDRVELVDGLLVDVSPPGARHSSAVAWLTRHFVGAVGEREVRVQDLLLVENGFLLPDLMVIAPPPRNRQPSSAARVVKVHRNPSARGYQDIARHSEGECIPTGLGTADVDVSALLG